MQTETAREEYECLKAVQSEEMHAQLKKINTAEIVKPWLCLVRFRSLCCNDMNCTEQYSCIYNTNHPVFYKVGELKVF